MCDEPRGSFDICETALAAPGAGEPVAAFQAKLESQVEALGLFDEAWAITAQPWY
jgi:hypothetical protein